MNEILDAALTVAIIILAILSVFCLIRSIIGPKIADRIIAVNMIGTLTMMIIAILTVKMKEGFLADVAVIYAMISFLAVVVITKVYIGVYMERHTGKEGKEKTDSVILEKREEN